MIKRFFDLLLSTLGLIVFSPLMLIIVLCLKVSSPGPIFYRGVRVGLNGQLFKIFKFRTMVADAEVIGGSSTSDKDVRITRVGLILRKYKFDELPQLINVFRGDMSLVGPRPEVKKYTTMYSDKEKMILTVRPGITDWASLVNSDEGAMLAKYDDPDKAYEEVIRPEKIKLQLKYVRERTLVKDFLIIFQTIKTIFMRRSDDRR